MRRMFLIDFRSLCPRSISNAAWRTSASFVEWKSLASSGVTDSSSLLKALSIVVLGVEAADIILCETYGTSSSYQQQCSPCCG